MRKPLPATPDKPQVAYSTNVHRGETLAEVYHFLREYTIPVKKRIFGAARAGLELRVGIGSAGELRRESAREAFREFLAESGLVCFSINAYPLLDFHSRRVKEQVFLPSWADPERSRWTNVIAAIFADILPEGVAGSISTLGGGFRPAGHGPETFAKMAANYVRTVDALADIEESTGKTIVLAVEPEPDTTFETSRDVVAFFEWYLLPTARGAWRGRGLSRAQAEERLRKFFTVNFDTCHFSVLFQNPVESLHQLWRAGIEVGKVHVTSAIVLRNPDRARAAYEQFRGMDEPRYFHQFCARGEDRMAVWRGLDLKDLPPRLIRGKHPQVSEIRSHYHVPIHLARWNGLETTQAETRDAVHEVLKTRRCSHLVIETYTWPLLVKDEKLIEGITHEFRWLRTILGKRWPK